MNRLRCLRLGANIAQPIPFEAQDHIFILSFLTQQLPPIEHVTIPLSSALQQSLPIFLHASPQQAIAVLIFVVPFESPFGLCAHPATAIARNPVAKTEIKKLHLDNMLLPS